MPKFVGNSQFSTALDAANPTLSVGKDGRVGIQTGSPNSTLHVAGTTTTEALIVAKATDTQQDSATIYGFNPRFNTWESASVVADGWTSVPSSGYWERSTDAYLGTYSVDFTSDGSTTSYWYREVPFDGTGTNHEPLYQDVFLEGSYSYKLDSYTSGIPGISITLTYRDAADKSSVSSNTFVAPVNSDYNIGVWQTVNWMASTPTGKEITKIKIELDPCRNLSGTNAADGASTYPKPTTDLTTGKNSIKYDNIIFDLFHANRTIINDYGTSNPYPTCDAVNLVRNSNELERFLKDLGK